MRANRNARHFSGPMAGMVLAIGLMATGLPDRASADGESFVDGLEAFDGGDVALTVRIWQRLADAGDSRAQVGLAGLHLAGNGVRQDPVEAARLYRLAAEQGDSNGQLNLGRLYLDGVGVREDKAAAYAWLSLAARQGRRWAEEQRQRLEPDLSDADRAEAEALITDIAARQSQK